MFYTYQLAIYFMPKQADGACLGLLKDVMAGLNAGKTYRFGGYGKHDRALLTEADTATLARQGGLVRLRETKRLKALGIPHVNFNCSIINAYPNCTLVLLIPALSYNDRMFAAEIFEVLKDMAMAFIEKGEPHLIQLNGIGDEGEDEDSILHPKRADLKAMPGFLAPYNYFDKEWISQAKVGALAPIARISSYPGGNSVEIDNAKPMRDINALLADWSEGKANTYYSRIMP